MRPIDADALVENLDKECGDLDLQYNSEYEQLVNYIESQPTLDYAPVRHGEWITVYPFEDNPQTTLKCSECHTCQPIYEHEEWTFCPFCGAKMDGGKEDD